ncbi:hypothetical protein LTR95_015251 [Oleoguttula sp. CCFEE 5521]
MAGSKVKAIYEYASQEVDDLSFPVGQIITITEQIDADWYEGEYVDASGSKKSGIFPNNFVEKHEPEIPSRPTRPTRQKEAAPVPQPVEPVAKQPEPAAEAEDSDEEVAPPLPVASKPQPPPMSIPAATPRAQDKVRSPKSAGSQQTSVAREELPPAPRPTPAQPAAAESKKPPPPVAQKTNAFKDRIAAFNATTAAPVLPFKPKDTSSYVKKPFVAPPPSSNAYVPPAIKHEPIQKPYHREEDPEIKQQQEDDVAAAEAAGFNTQSRDAQEEDEEDAPKPQSLKERIAALQAQQAEQAQRKAGGGGEKRERKAPVKKPSEPVLRDEDVDVEQPVDSRKSLDAPRERPRVPSAQQPPLDPATTNPPMPQHEILSGGEEADQSAAGDTTEDDTGTIGHDDSDEKPVAPRRASTAPRAEPDADDEEEATEVAESDGDDSVDEETRRKEELRQRMAKMSGGMGMPGMFGGMPPAGSTPKKRSTSGKRTASKQSDEQSAAYEQQPRVPMVPIPGMHRVQSPESEPMPQQSASRAAGDADSTTGGRTAGEASEAAGAPFERPSRTSTTEERDMAPSIPTGRIPRKPTPSRLQRVDSAYFDVRSVGNAWPSYDSTVCLVDAIVVSRVVRRPESQYVDRGAAPPVPGDRSVPALPPSGNDASQSRPVPPPPSAAPVRSPGPGSESDDESSLRAPRSSAGTPLAEAPLPVRNRAPPIPGQREPPPLPPQSPQNNRASYFGSESSMATPPGVDKRTSRVPTIPTDSPIASPRPPPPPPPTAAPPTRRNTDLQPGAMADDERESDYEGDYDTDIASSAKHKAALTSHAREASLDDSTTGGETPVLQQQAAPPPLPTQRAVPPLPPQAAQKSRQSVDLPRAPPPMPPPRDLPSSPVEGDDYDPYRYAGMERAVPPVPSSAPIAIPPVPQRDAAPAHNDSSDDMYSASPPRKSLERPPPPPPREAEQDDRVPFMPPAPRGPPPAREPTRQSLDVQRVPTVNRPSMDQSRPAGGHDQIARDIDLNPGPIWWTAAQPLPLSLQARNGNDILSESEESTTSRRGGRTTISKDIYILYLDYSQTVITVRYDSRDPSEGVSLEQRHEPSPIKLRQEQLEAYHLRFGARIAELASSLGNSKKDTLLGDGSPAAFPVELLRSLPNAPEALLPIGSRAYGAMIYTNLANASIMQHDEIRPGDIITFRNAKFEGKHSGPIHSKYKLDLGPGHVGVVGEWDGSKKKVRVWEQGLEGEKGKKGKKGVEGGSYRLGDLKSGEVRVWRVVGREWVGWEQGGN